MRDPRLDPGKMARRDLLIGGGCLAGAVLGGSASAWNAPRKLPDGGLDALVPKRLGDWRLTGTNGVIVAEEREDVRGPYDDLLTRIYRAEGSPPITLLVAYGGSQREDVQLHRPEGCYPAAGFTLSDREPVRLRLAGAPVVSAQMILAEAPLRTEQVLYWTRIGAEFPTSIMEQRWAVVRENLAGRTPDGVLVRLSAPGADRDGAASAFRAFLTALLASSSPAAARVLVGGPA